MRGVRGRHIVDVIEPNHRHHGLNARNHPDDVLGLGNQGLGPVGRRALGEPHGGVEGALVVGRQEARLGHPEQPGRGGTHHRHCHDSIRREPHQPAHDRDITVARPVDGSHHPGHWAATG